MRCVAMTSKTRFAPSASSTTYHADKSVRANGARILASCPTSRTVLRMRPSSRRPRSPPRYGTTTAYGDVVRLRALGVGSGSSEEASGIATSPESIKVNDGLNACAMILGEEELGVGSEKSPK